MKVSIFTETGFGKNESEDVVIVNDKVLNDTTLEFGIDQLNIIGVADGVGGNAGGKEAARFLLERLRILPKDFESKDDLLLKIKQINDDIIKAGNQDPTNQKMATVFSGIILGINRHYLIHIGNTRVYVQRGRFLNCITEDQTMKALYERNGNYAAADTCNPSEIYGCFGGGNPELVRFLEVSEIDNEAMGSLLLMTSDGIHDYVSVSFIENLLAANITDVELLREISNEALKNGSRDDRSMVIIRL